MAPQPTVIQAQLRQLIYYHLDNDFPQNALFLAERLHGLDCRNPDAAHLLALCHLRTGNLRAAYDYSRERAKKGSHLGCAYVYAQACLGLGRYVDGIQALTSSKGLWHARNHWNKHSHTQRQHLPDAAAVYCLLGKLRLALDDKKQSAHDFVDALKINPFMWNAFRELCDAGIPLQPNQVFAMTTDMITETASINGYSAVEHSQHLAQSISHPAPAVTPGADPFNTTSRTAGDPGLNHGGGKLLSRLNGSLKEPKPRPPTTWETPTNGSHDDDEDTMMGNRGYTQESDMMQAAPRKGRAPSEQPSEASRSMTTRSRTKHSEEPGDEVRPISSLAMKRTISGRAPPSSAIPAEAPARRSNRLLNHIRPTSSKLGLAGKDGESKTSRAIRKPMLGTERPPRTTTSTVGRVVSGNRKIEPSSRAERPSHDQKESSRAPSIASTAHTREPAKRSNSSLTTAELSPEREGLQYLLELLSKLGDGYYHLSRYQCPRALQIFSSLPSAHLQTPWVLAQIGRAQYEKASYTESCETFTKLRTLQPSRIEDMEIFSTVLWHLKQDITLAHLSHELIEQDRLSPQSWCAIGNSFSQQREHEQAIKCFRRATQLDPKFAYAFTLQGHEHVASEELDKAQHAYRCAIAASSRHYNGWYGLATCYEKLGQYPIAEKHYKYAASINPSNSVLHVCIGRVLEKMQNYAGALTNYAKAAAAGDKNARFMKARVLMKIRRYNEALGELEDLKEVVPEEATVHYMLGKLYKVMGRKGLAVRHFTVALNLDPKAAPHIKEALETLEHPSDGEEDDDDQFDD